MKHDQSTHSNHIPVKRTHLEFRDFKQGAFDILPLSIAILPWGILVGSVAINAGLSFYQAFAMSAVVFAGAAQLVSLGLVMADASTFTIILTVFFLTTQHLMYALNLRSVVQAYSWKKRIGIGFLLTDELFAVAMAKKTQWTFMYLFGAGLSFYFAWCLFSLLGIFAATLIPNLDDFHLDFSIAAVFIFIIVPLIKNKATLVGVVVTLILSCLFKYLELEAGIILVAFTGMFCAVCLGGSKE